MKAKSFKYWFTQELHEQFGLIREDNSPLLKEWITSNADISETEQKRLEDLRSLLATNAEYWNEEELKMKFIGQLLDLVNLDTPQYRWFYDRPIRANVNGMTLNGTVDMMVSTGFQLPKKPFFCIHEYKQEAKRDNDPKGQLLIEMIAAQTLNQNEFPVYGCYVIGRSWFFVVLIEKQYDYSVAFDASQEDIFQIFKNLRNIKVRIEKQLKTN